MNGCQYLGDFLICKKNPTTLKKIKFGDLSHIYYSNNNRVQITLACETLLYNSDLRRGPEFYLN